MLAPGLSTLMNRHSPASLFAAALLLGSSLSAHAVPQWIWTSLPHPGADKIQVVWLRHELDVPAQVKKATLTLAADREASIILDGREVATSSNNGQAEAIDLTVLFAGRPAEKRVLGFRASNKSGKGGVVAQLKLEGAAGSPVIVETDASWQVLNKAAPGWDKVGTTGLPAGPASLVAMLGGAPWQGLTAAKFAQIAALPPAIATPADKFTTLPGFKVEQLYNVPKIQGSWTALCTDPKGRLIASDQYGPLYRITPGPVGGKPEDAKIEELPIAMGHANGLLWAFDSLYVMVCQEGVYESGSGVYRVTFKNDQPDKVELLRKIKGSGDHGPHALVLSPDCKSITVICGNATQMTDMDESAVPKLYDEDQVLPRLIGHGFMQKTGPPAGHIARMSPDGKHWTLSCMGFRNPYDMAYNHEGELFTYDADMEWDLALPWYRPTRVCHAVDGADFGWRNCSGKQREYYPDTVPPVYNVGMGCPTGLTFGYGAKFPARYQDALFICDWTYGKLYAVHLTPQGATYTADLETFFEARPLPISDIVINPADGAMYFTTGGRRGQSALYRVTYTGSESIAPSPARPEAGRELRALRHQLESFYTKQDPAAVTLALPLLDHPDRFIRYAARTVLEFQPVGLWAEMALAKTSPDAVLNTSLALARLAQKPLASRIFTSLLDLDIARLGEPQQLDVLRTIGVVSLRLGDPVAGQLTAMVNKIDALLPSTSARVNHELLQLAVRFKAPNAAAKGIALLAKAASQEEQVTCMQSLRLVNWGWTPALREPQLRWFLQEKYNRNDNVGKFVANIRQDTMASLSDSEKAALKTVLEAKPESRPAPAVASRPFVKHWETSELLPKVEALIKKRGRSFETGRKLFKETGCVACHAIAGDGGAVGPDLTLVGGRFGVREILESIIEPSKVISDQYGTVIVTLKDGTTYLGKLAGENPEMVQIQENLFTPSDVRAIPRKDIQKIQASPVSLMPPALIDTCQPEEAADLVSYLISGGKQTAAAKQP